MPLYLWRGKNRKNRVRKGEMEALDENAVRARLARQGITATKIRRKPKDLFENISFLQPRITEKNIIVFARQLSTMIDAGLPIVQSLDILVSQEENPTLRKVLSDIKGTVEGGTTFADALKKYPKYFDTLFVNMVAAGEASGVLDLILRRLSAYMEKMAKLKSRVRGAMIYPLVTVIIALFVVGVILVWVVPVFETMFVDFGSALPTPTQMIVDASRYLKKNFWFVLAIFIAIVFAFKMFYKSMFGRKMVDSLVLRIPTIGDLARKVAISRFARPMGTMLASGVPILESLNLVAGAAGNKVLESAIYDTRDSIAEGRIMADPLMESGVFPGMVCSMIAVGESTGALDAMLEKIADFYDEEVDQAVENITSLIEPFILVFLGVIVGGLVVAMYLPVFQMAGAVGG